MATPRNWALVLGASSGFGEAASLALARGGRNVFGVHLDRRATLPNVERVTQGIEAAGSRAVFFNMNAADDERRAEALAGMAKVLDAEGRRAGVDVVMHSLAFGTLKPFLAADAVERISKPQMEMTVDVMAHSLVYWMQDLVAGGVLPPGAHAFAMTSAGGGPPWEGPRAAAARRGREGTPPSPPASEIFSPTPRRAGFSSCSPKPFKACGMGMAALSSAAISRVNAVISFRRMRLPNGCPWPRGVSAEATGADAA